jgi:uncharacterized membrane protein
MNATAPGNSTLVLPGRSTPLGAGWNWLAGGWRLFMRAPLMWIISVILVFICVVAVSLVPFLGQVVVALLQPVILAGFMIACQSLERGGDFDLDHLLGGFRKSFGNLVVVGLLFLVGQVVIFVVFVAFIFFTVGTAVLMGGSQQEVIATILAAGLTFALGMLIMLALLLPLFAAYWFAPVLVVMHDVAPLEAMKASFFACFRNFLPFLVYSILMIPLAILAAIPFGLGFLVLIPMLIASVWVSYREIFTEEAASEPAKPTFA